MAQQLSFDLPAKEVLGRDDFFVSPSNQLAVAMVENPDDWPTHALTLTGQSGSGKTHLTHVWSDLTGAQIIQARDIASADIPALAARPVAVEDVQNIAADRDALNALFHLYNLTSAQAVPLLLTGNAPPSDWNLILPDIQSRVQAACHVTLDAPDDTLLSVVLAKLFADRQITPKPDVIPYLLGHMERSFAAAADVVQQLDRLSLDEKRTITRKLAARVIKAHDT